MFYFFLEKGFQTALNQKSLASQTQGQSAQNLSKTSVMWVFGSKGELCIPF